MAKSYYQQREDETKILIAEAKVRNNLTDVQLAQKIGIPLGTLRNQKSHPGRMRLDYIWAIEKLAGRKLGGTIDADNL